MSQNVHPIQFLEIDGLEVSSLEIGHKKREQTYKKYFKQKNSGWVEKKT